MPLRECISVSSEGTVNPSPLRRAECKVQRHLNEPRAADGMLQYSQVAGRRERISKYSRTASWIRLRGVAEPRIERNIVAGDIEAGMIEDIERLQVIL